MDPNIGQIPNDDTHDGIRDSIMVGDDDDDDDVVIDEGLMLKYAIATCIF